MSVLVFPRKNPYHWCFIGDHHSSFSELLAQRQHPLTCIFSEEELLREFSTLEPSLIFLEETISWGKPFGILETLNRISKAPKVLVVKKSPRPKQEKVFKEAYSLGVLEVLEFPLNQQEWMESLTLFTQLSEKMSGH